MRTSTSIYCAIAALTSFAVVEAYRTSGPNHATTVYLATLRLTKFEHRGANATSPMLSPMRLGKPIEELDTVFDYDFDRLDRVVRRLDGVDRRTVFREMFARICDGCRTDHERHLAVLEFCNRASFHNDIQPMWRDGGMVADPLVLLELGEQRCGQTARVATALFDAAGYRARLLQLGMHVAAEIHYDGDWHYFDAGLFGGRWTVLDDDGTIPSLAELAAEPFAIDALPANLEATWRNTPSGSGHYPSWFYHSKQAFDRPRFVRERVATPRQEQRSRDYGWEHHVTARDRSPLHEFEPRYFPAAVSKLRADGATVTWKAARDLDGDLLGYRVFVGSESRGWCYGPGWRPSMYDARFRLPPRDVDWIETTDTEVTISSEVRPLFVTVMPFDAHGEAVGRTLYPMSVELRLDETD